MALAPVSWKRSSCFFPWVCQCCQVILTIVSGDHTLTLCTALLILLFTLFSISDNASIAFQFFSRNSYIPQKRNERIKHSLMWKGHKSLLFSQMLSVVENQFSSMLKQNLYHLCIWKTWFIGLNIFLFKTQTHNCSQWINCTHPWLYNV